MGQLDTVLPLLRPRNAEITWYLAVFSILLGLGLILLLVLYVLRLRRHRRQVVAHFLGSATTRGLTPHQGALLLAAAAAGKVHRPTLLLTSVYSFDRCVSTHLAARLRAHPEAPEIEEFGRIRKILGFDDLPPEQLLRSTHQLRPGLTLRLAADTEAETEEEEEVEAWILVARSERELTLAPLLQHAPRVQKRREAGDQVSLRFWRDGDTQYRFTTEILATHPTTHTLDLRHVDRLERIQKRDFYRLAIRFPISLITLPAAPEPWQISDHAEPPTPLEQTSDAAAATEAEVAAGMSDQPGEETTPEEAPQRDETGQSCPPARVAAEVVNLSAGGMQVAIPASICLERWLQVAPDFVGAFPLAGILCELVQRSPASGGELLQLRFLDLTPRREAELVQLISQQQIATRHHDLEADDVATPTSPESPLSTAD